MLGNLNAHMKTDSSVGILMRVAIHADCMLAANVVIYATFVLITLIYIINLTKFYFTSFSYLPKFIFIKQTVACHANQNR